MPAAAAASSTTAPITTTIGKTVPGPIANNVAAIATIAPPANAAPHTSARSGPRPRDRRAAPAASEEVMIATFLPALRNHPGS